MKKIAIFASGEGTNAQRLMEFYKGSAKAEITLILTNKATAGVIARGEREGVPVHVLPKVAFEDGTALRILREAKVDFVVLAGFLLKISADIIASYPRRIVNIHPSLLPKYGGKGMYGSHVHEAVITNKEKESGITIHYVNEHYDEGEFIFQARCAVTEEDTTDTLAQKVHALEYEHCPQVVDMVVGAE